MYCRNPSRQSGAALVVALLIFALCAALLVSIEKEGQLFYQRMANGFQGQQTYAYLLGAEQLAFNLLQLDNELDAQTEVPRDTLMEVWAEQSPPYPLDEGGYLVGRLEDLEGRFNLNTLVGNTGATDSSALTLDQRIFVRLLLTLGNEDGPLLDRFQAVAIVNAIGDWLDGDNNPRSNGAEDLVYQSKQPPYRAANRMWVSPSELMAIEGVTWEIYQQLAPLVTIWPDDGGKINIHTAPAQVLQALPGGEQLEPKLASDVQMLVEQRDQLGFGSVDELLQDPFFAENDRAALQPLLTEKTSTFLLMAEASVAERPQQLYSVLSRKNGQFRVLTRVQGTSL